jgi:alpha-galactosidase
MNRRHFLHLTSASTFGILLPEASSIAQGLEQSVQDQFEWLTKSLRFSYSVSKGRLRQGRLLPVGVASPVESGSSSSGVEAALQCTGENSPDPGMKSAMGMPGLRLRFIGKREDATPKGHQLTLAHRDSKLSLDVESIYEAFQDAPMVRRRTRVTNTGNAPVGIDFLSSAMLHGLADPQHFEHEIRIHVPFNSWMAEGQWNAFKPSEMSFVEN